MTIEEHPLKPFLPENGRILFLGSFPPPRPRWSMEFFYPNWINDFWRIQGLLHYHDKQHFELTDQKRFNLNSIIPFCHQQGLAFYDTARKVCRMKDNASDEHLEILETTDVLQLVSQMPLCHTIVTTGGKASEELSNYFAAQGITLTIPKVGDSTPIITPEWQGTWWRMPSTSRAYPMKLEKKAEYYKRLIS